MNKKRALSALLICGLCSEGCGDSGTQKEDPSLGSPYLPLEIGHGWIYDEVLVATQETLGVLTKTITKSEELDGRLVYIHDTTQTNSPVTKRSYWLLEEGTVQRVKQERLDESDALLDYREYEPGFLRFDDRLAVAGAQLEERHVRREYNAAGALLESKTKNYTWIVESVDEEVVVPAGTFSCVRVRRIDADVGDKTYWYALGVGKILERDSLEEERLRDLVPTP